MPGRYRAVLKATRCSYVTRVLAIEATNTARGKARNVRREILVYSVNEAITSRVTFVHGSSTCAFLFCAYVHVRARARETRD